MRPVMCAVLLLWLAGNCFGQTQPALCPKHIETPSYPAIARTAHIAGKIILAVTIDADGIVKDAKITNNGKFVKLLGGNATDNIRRWTFVNPPTAPYTEMIVYDYEFDESGHVLGTQVNFDLPGRVTILSDVPTIETTQSTKH